MYLMYLEINICRLVTLSAVTGIMLQLKSKEFMFAHFTLYNIIVFSFGLSLIIN